MLATEAIGKLASTRVGQAVAQFATQAGERVAGTARAAGGWLGREGAALDAAAAEAGLGKAVQAPKALGQALGNLESRATQAVANAFRPAASAVPGPTLAERAAMAPENYELESTLEAWGARNTSQPAAPVRGAESAANRAMHEQYVDELRAAMGQPHVRDPELNRLMSQLYRPGATVGSGSTAAAVRFEAATGGRVGGRTHAQKTRDSIRALKKWIEKNPTAPPGDRAAAENVIRDMSNALEGR